jgi:anti-anti-sigma factor
MRWPFASEVKPGVTVVRFRGHLEIDLLAADRGNFESLVGRAFGQGRGCVLIEMSAVASIHPIVLARLVRLAVSAIEAGGQVRWCAPSPRLRRLFLRIGLDERFPVHSSEAEALRQFALSPA